MLIEPIKLKTWEEFVDLENTDQLKSFIYRGHSNTISKDSTEEWGITSSFKRYYRNKEIRFESFISSKLESESFKSQFENYSSIYAVGIVNMKILEKIYFFQHYGIPTCFIDFTKNPLVALFFAITGIKTPIVKQFSTTAPITFPENAYFTIIKLDIDELVNTLRIKKMADLNICWNYEDYKLKFPGFIDLSLAIDLNPETKVKDESLNWNLISQEGCFLFYDNTERKGDYNFESLLDDFSSANENLASLPIITKYHIPYNSILSGRPGENKISLFEFLASKNAIGRYLFNDIQGIKYDLVHYLNS